MIRNYQKTQSKLKAMKAAGLSKDETVGVLIDGTMDIIEVEVQDDIQNLAPAQIAQNFIEAYRGAKKELEKMLKEQTSADDLKEMLGV